MKLLLCLLLTTWSTISICQIYPPAPDTIYLKSGEIAIGKIVEDESNVLKFYLSSDPEQTIKKVLRTYVTKYVDNKWGSQLFNRDEKGEISYTEVVQTDSISKDQLFMNAKVWIIDNYKDSDAVTEIADKENGLIITEGWFKITTVINRYPYDYRVNHSVKLQIKDGRYKYTLYNFSIDIPSTQYTSATTSSFESIFSDESKLNKAQVLMKEEIMRQLYYSILNLKKGMVSNKGEDKW